MYLEKQNISLRQRLIFFKSPHILFSLHFLLDVQSCSDGQTSTFVQILDFTLLDFLRMNDYRERSLHVHCYRTPKLCVPGSEVLRACWHAVKFSDIFLRITLGAFPSFQTNNVSEDGRLLCSTLFVGEWFLWLSNHF